MTNSEAIRCLENIKKEKEKYAFTTALDMAIESLKRDEIGLTDTVKEIHDGVYKQGYEQGRADAIEKYHLKLLNCQTTKVKSIHDAEIWVEFKRQSTNIAEKLKEKE